MSHAIALAPAVRKPKDPPVYAVGQTASERETAFQLVYQSYLRSGLCRRNRHAMRVTPYHLLPTTTVFNAFVADTVVSTMTLIEDGDLGIPMESMYADQIAERRAAGLRVGEVSCLADRRSNCRRFLDVFCKLARLMAQYARFHGLDQLLVVVHPRHARFYERFLGFQPIGGLTECPHVQNNPAVALCLDFAQVDREPPDCYDSFFGMPIPADELTRPRLSARELVRLGELVDDCFEQADTMHHSSTEPRVCTV